MAVTKDKKRAIAAKLKDIFSGDDTVAFVNFHGLGVADTTELRRKLREEGVSYVVAKKTLVRRALDDAKLPGEQPALEGELALAWGPETAPAQGVYEFAKGHEGTLALLGGIFEGTLIGKEEIDEIAQIPPLEVLRGMFVNLIFSPVQRFAIALDQIAQAKK